MPDSSIGVRYRRNLQWFFVTPPPPGFEGDVLLENSLGGRVTTDNAIRELLTALDGGEGLSREELAGLQIVSTDLLDVFLTVYSGAGIIQRMEDCLTLSGGVETVANESLPEQAEPLGTGDSDPLISAVIVNYNGDRHLPELLTSLEGQSWKKREIIVVDNCSRDNSCAYIRSHHPGVRLLEQRRNSGFAAAVNVGIKASRGEYILILNNDILADERALENLVLRASALKQPWGAIAPKMKFYNNRAFINALGNSLYPVSWGSDNYIGFLDLGRFDDMAESFSACFGAVLLNRRAVEAVGGLDPKFGFYYEDMDWSYRARLRGYPIYTAPASVFYHKFGASMSAESEAFKTRYVVGNRLYFAASAFSGAVRRRFLAGYLREDFRAMITHLFQRRLKMLLAYWRGYLRLLCLSPFLIVKSFSNEKARRQTGILHHQVLALSTPFNLTTMDRGYPRLDTFSLRVNYREKVSGSADLGEIALQRAQPPADRRKGGSKLFMEFSFHIAQSGAYSIHLAGLLRGPSPVYLDGEAVPESTPIPRKKLDIIRSAGIFHLDAGIHYVELARRCHAQAIIIRKVDKS